MTQAFLLALAVAASALAAGDELPRPEPDHRILRHHLDVDVKGEFTPLGDRLPVVFVHGLRAEDLEVKESAHVSFSILYRKLTLLSEGGREPFATVMPVFYSYAPYQPYPELAKDFSARMRTEFGDRMLLMVVHSAGALLVRHAGKDLNIVAEIGVAPAHGGSPGASIIYGKKTLLDDGRITPEVWETLKETKASMHGLPEAVVRSVAWDNSDGVITEELRDRYGVATQPPLPPFNYARLDHYGIFEHFVPMFGALGDLVADKDKRGKDLRKREWEAIKAFSEEWKLNDGVVVPYPTPENEEYPTWSRTWKGIGHRELFFDKDVLQLVWEQVLDIADQVREASVSEP